MGEHVSPHCRSACIGSWDVDVWMESIPVQVYMYNIAHKPTTAFCMYTNYIWQWYGCLAGQGFITMFAQWITNL